MIRIARPNPKFEIRGSQKTTLATPRQGPAQAHPAGGARPSTRCRAGSQGSGRPSLGRARRNPRSGCFPARACRGERWGRSAQERRDGGGGKHGWWGDVWCRGAGGCAGACQGGGDGRLKVEMVDKQWRMGNGRWVMVEGLRATGRAGQRSMTVAHNRSQHHGSGGAPPQHFQGLPLAARHRSVRRPGELAGRHGAVQGRVCLAPRWPAGGWRHRRVVVVVVGMGPGRGGRRRSLAVAASVVG